MSNIDYNFIKKYEGLRLNAYKDPVGIWTIGYGSLVMPNGNKVKRGDKITNKEAEVLLKNKADEFYKDILKLIKVPLNNNQSTALTSFVYNVGINAFKNSTLLKRINNKDKNASDEFTRWIYAKGKILNGLVKRRNDEKSLFNK